jgi:hypothetical protein
MRSARFCGSFIIGSKTFSSSEECINEFHRITETVDRLVPPRIHQNIFCYGGFCGPWTEDMWPGFANFLLSDFTFTVPLVAPWVKMWPFHRSRSFADIERILEVYRRGFYMLRGQRTMTGSRGGTSWGSFHRIFSSFPAVGKGTSLFSYWRGRSIVRTPIYPLNSNAIFCSWVISTATGCGPE